jgi:hypothetical protein
MHLTDFAFFTGIIVILCILVVMALDGETSNLSNHVQLRKHLQKHVPSTSVARFKSKHGQDKWMEHRLGKYNGVFVEFGAMDGVTQSSTYYYEKKYNWTGVLIEPDETVIGDITTNRPNAVFYNALVCPAGSESADFDISKFHGESGTNIPTDDILKTFSIGCVDLNHIVPRKVDYMVVDTVGSEFEILQTFHFHAHDIDYVQVKKSVELTKLMVKNGYRKLHEFEGGDVLFEKLETSMLRGQMQV